MSDATNTLAAFIASLLLRRPRTGEVGDRFTGSGPGNTSAGEPIERRSAPYEDEGRTISAIRSSITIPQTMADAILKICHERGTCDRFGGADMTLMLAPMLLGLSNSAPAVEEEESSNGGGGVMRWQDITGQFTAFAGIITGDALDHDILVGNLSHGQGVFYLIQIWGVNTAVGGSNVATIKFKRADGTTIHTLTFTVTIGNSLNHNLRAWASLNPAEEKVYNLIWASSHRTEDATGGTTIENATEAWQSPRVHVPGLAPNSPAPGLVPITISLANSLAASSYNVESVKIYALK